jgi:hypothetical protein
VKPTGVALALLLTGCSTGALPWAQGERQSESACAASCNAHHEQCPQVFAAFPAQAAVECPAQYQDCLKRCNSGRESNSAASAPLLPAVAPAAAGMPVPAAASREARLRELKHLHDERLITDDVYRERQIAILSEP